jgi:hypothetical protein
MVLILGRLPEPWSSWEERKNCFENEPDGDGRAIQIASIRKEKKRLEISDPRSIRETLDRALP